MTTINEKILMDDIETNSIEIRNEIYGGNEKVNLIEIQQENEEVEETDEELFRKFLEGTESNEEIKRLEKEIDNEEFVLDSDDLSNRKKGNLTREQEKMLFGRLKDKISEEERETIVNYIVYKNFKLIFTVLKSKFRGLMGPKDAYSQGIIGLYEAIYRFEIGKDYKFSTYRIWYIRKYLQEFVVDFKYGFKVTGHKLNEIAVIKKVQEDFRKQHGRMPEYKELFELTGMAKKTFDGAFSLMNTAYMSLDVGPSSNEEMNLHNLIEGDNLEKSNDQKNNLELIKIACEKVLKPVEKKVFEMLNGFSLVEGCLAEKEMTPDEISEVLGLTRSDIRKFNRHAVVKIKEALEEMLEENKKTSNNRFKVWED